jgi:hypothetical protein
MTNISIRVELAIIDLSRSESYEKSEEEVLFTKLNLSSIYYKFFDNNDLKDKKSAKLVKNKLEDTKNKKKFKDYSKLVSSDNDSKSSDSDTSNKDKDKDKYSRDIIAPLDLRDILIISSIF